MRIIALIDDTGVIERILKHLSVWDPQPFAGVCRAAVCSSVFLETTDGLPESQALYEKLGFTVTTSAVEKLWDGPRPLIVMAMDLA